MIRTDTAWARALFTTVWRSQLYREGYLDTVIEVRGWKTALIDDGRWKSRRTATFCLRWWPPDWKHFTYPYTVRRATWLWLKRKYGPKYKGPRGVAGPP